MSRAQSPAYDLAVRLLRSEGAGDDCGSEVITAAADRVIRRLRAHLVECFGSDGYGALISYALRRLRSANLASTTASALAEGKGAAAGALDSLLHSAARRSPAEARDACVTVIETTIALLMRLVGEDMTFSLVTHVAPNREGGRPCPVDAESREGCA